MTLSEPTLLPIYELVAVYFYRIYDRQFVLKFPYRSPSDFQAVRDALDHINTMAARLDMTVVSLEVFCLDLGFRGLNPDEPDLIASLDGRQIYDMANLGASLIQELPAHIHPRAAG